MYADRIRHNGIQICQVFGQRLDINRNLLRCLASQAVALCQYQSDNITVTEDLLILEYLTGRSHNGTSLMELTFGHQVAAASCQQILRGDNLIYTGIASASSVWIARIFA